MKWIFRLFGVVLTVVLMCAVALLLIPAERLARIAADQIAAETGRTVGIAGPVSVTLWPVLGLRVEGLAFGNADWAGPEPMLKVASAAIAVDPAGLFGGEIRVTGIEAHRPTVRLARRADGRANWQFAPPGDAEPARARDAVPAGGSDPGPPEPARAITVARIDITEARLFYETEDRAPFEIDGVDMSLDWPDPAGPAEIMLELAPAAQAIEARLTLSDVPAVLAGEDSPLEARITTASGDVRFAGRGTARGAASGTLTLATKNTDALLAAFGLPPAGLPPKLGRSIDAITALTLTTDGRLSLREMRLDLAGNVISGTADVTLAARPRIDARLDAGMLDLDTGSEARAPARSGEGNRARPVPRHPAGWSTDPIDADALGLFDGAIALEAEGIDFGTIRLGQSRMMLRNEASRMVFDLREVQAYGGRAAGEFVLNNRNGLSVGGRMEITGVEMRDLLADSIEVDRLTGRGDLRLSFLGVGQSVDAIMRSLSGDGALSLGQGTVQGIDLDSLLRGGGLGSGTTIFDDLSATWSIAGGVMSNRDLLMQLRNYRVTGAGEVDLGARRLDYRVTPVALRADSGRGIAFPVVFEGPWTDLSIRPDIEAAAGARLDAERERLKERAREKLGEELGVAPAEGQSTEDVIKKEIGDRLLRKLFD